MSIKYKDLSLSGLTNLSETDRMNLILDRLERIEGDIQKLSAEIDVARMETEASAAKAGKR